jgi:hypothetical protein
MLHRENMNTERGKEGSAIAKEELGLHETTVIESVGLL